MPSRMKFLQYKMFKGHKPVAMSLFTCRKEGNKIDENSKTCGDYTRWEWKMGKSKGMPRNYGHTVGAKNVETVCQAADELGIEYLTLYAFSTENWNRPDSEVAALMKLLESYLKNCIRTANKNNMRVRVIGELSRLSESFQKKIQELEEVSAANTGLNLTIAINYGSRDEMLRV